MRSLVKSLVLLGVCTVMSIGLTSCSSDEGVSQNTKEELKNYGLTSSNIQKDWVMSHFEFTESCSKEAKRKYQLSMVNLKLKGDRYESYDTYHLEEDFGVWTLDNNILTLTSDSKPSSLVLKIESFTSLEMNAEVIGSSSISRIQLVSK